MGVPTIADRLFLLIMRFKVAILLGVTIFTIILAWFAAQVKFDNTIETYFLKKDIKDYQQFLRQFGTDEIIAIAFGEKNIFTRENLGLIDTLSRELKKLPHIRRVLSLTTAKIVYGKGEDVYFDPLINKIPETAKEMAARQNLAQNDAFIPGTLLSSNGKSTAIVAEIDHIIGEFDYKIELLTQIRALLQKLSKKTGKRFYIGGTAVLDDALFRYNQRDQSRFIPLMVLVMLLIVSLMFRRLEIIAIPILIVLLSVIWTYGFLVLLGYKINIISTIIMPLLMAVAVADSMHFITDYLQEASSGEKSKIECIRQSFKNLLTPCFMTSLTTILGLLSLMSADLVPIRQFGLVAAAGVLFAFILTILLLPLWLSFIPYPKEKYRRKIQSGAFAGFLAWLGHWRKNMAIAVVLFPLAVSLPAIFSLKQLMIGTNSLDYFRKDDSIRQQTEWIDEHIGGTASLEFFVDTGKEDALKNPSLLHKMEQFQNYLKGIDGITGVYSVVDMVKSLNKAFNGGDEQKFKIPSSQLKIAQELFLVEGSREIGELISNDYSKGRITARVAMNKSQQLAHKMPEIESRMQKIFANAALVKPTGVVYLMNQMERYILSSQIKSFLLAFLVISLSVILMLRSLKLGLLSMIPNILPILFTLALMPLFNIHLDVGTVMIAGVALGLVVDDTIHFLSRLKLEAGQGTNIREAIARVIYSTGRPIIFTSLVLSLGFVVLIFASFNPIIHFGILSSILIVLALAFDLVVLPAAMGLIQPKL